jgi:phytoene dehydrogenase-like protein
MLRFAPAALRPTTALAGRFASAEARALLAGNAAHAGTPLERRLTAAIGTTLMAAGHAVGWPFPRGGAGRLTEALAGYFTSIGGTIETGRRVTNLEMLPTSRATLLALTFRQVGRLAGKRLPTAYRRACEAWRYGPGAFKVDWALDGPIPWADARVSRAGTVHLGGTLEEIAASERAPSAGRVCERPFVLLAQPSLFDPTRAPEGRHTAWAYCHVPNGWDGDATDAIEAQVERFAPGFTERILSRAAWSPRRLEAWDANLVGGDVNGGAPTLRQMIGPRRWPVRGWRAGRDLYVCSASAPPGGGVHGMAGFHAARAALRHTFGINPD